MCQKRPTCGTLYCIYCQTVAYHVVGGLDRRWEEEGDYYNVGCAGLGNCGGSSDFLVPITLNNEKSMRIV